MNNRFFTTLIGFGKVASSISNDKKMAKFIKYQTHAQVLKSNKNFCWNAVVEPDKEKSELAKKIWNIPIVVDSISKLPRDHKIDVLVNNVGTFVPGKLIDEEDTALEKMININLFSNYWVTKGLVSILTQKKKGHIFNMCSIASKVAYANGGSYCISKFALYGMSQCLREELKDYNIKVTSVLPGAVRTGSWDGTLLPDERFINPDDVSNSIYSSYRTSKGATIEEIIIRPQLGDI